MSEAVQSDTNPGNTPTNEGDNTKTFEKIQLLQSRIKKESAKQEIFIEVKKHFLDTLKTECKEIFKWKVEAASMFDQRDLSNVIPYKLRNFDKLGKNCQSNVTNNLSYILRLFDALPRRYDFVFKLWDLAKTSESRIHLSSFFTNFFYDNILSSSNYEVELLIIIFTFLRNDIRKLKKSNVPWMYWNDEESMNSHIFRNWLRKDNVKEYFGEILSEIVEIIELGDEKTMSFDIVNINESLASQNKHKSKSNNNPNQPRPSALTPSPTRNSLESVDQWRNTIKAAIHPKPNIQTNDHNQRDLINDLWEFNFTKSNLISLCFKQDSDIMKNYWHKQIQEIKHNEFLFSTNSFMTKLSTLSFPDATLKTYLSFYSWAMKVIKKLFVNWNQNIEIAPYSIKCICKMIKLLVQKKFKRINTYEWNEFIAEFFFNKILKPIFIIPDFNGLMINVFVSKSTKQSIILLQKIIKKLVSGHFFKSEEDCNLTLFNGFFLSQMPEVLNFFDKITEVNLPGIIEELLESSIMDYSYKNNPEEVERQESVVYKNIIEERIQKDKMVYSSICFTFDDIIQMALIMKQNMDFFMKNKRDLKDDDYKLICASLNNLQKKIDEFEIRKQNAKTNRVKDSNKKKLKNGEKEVSNQAPPTITQTKSNSKNKQIPVQDEEKEKNKEKVKCKEYFWYEYPTYSKQYKELMTKDDMHNFFFLEPINETSVPDLANKNLVIKVLNHISRILYNFLPLNKYDFISCSISNTEDIFRSLLVFLKTDFFVLNSAIPLDWYVKSLLNWLNELPEEYRANDYDKWYSEFKSYLGNTIYENNMELISELKTKQKNICFTKETIQHCINKLKIVISNTKTQEFVENHELEVFMKREKDKELNKNMFVIKKKDEFDHKIQYWNNLLFEQKSNQGSNCKTIYEFTKKFPNYPTLEYQELDEVPKALKDYLNKIVYESLNDKSDNITNTWKTEKPEVKEGKIKEFFYSIVEYVMNKIGSKLLNLTHQTELDKVIQRNCYRYFWVDIIHMFEKDIKIVDNLMPSINKLIKQFLEDKCPFKKLKLVAEMRKLIESNTIFFNSKGQNGADEVANFMNVMFIKAKPKFFDTTWKFIKMYITVLPSDHPDLGQYTNTLSYLEMFSNFILKISYDQACLNKISWDESIILCKQGEMEYSKELQSEIWRKA